MPQTKSNPSSNITATPEGNTGSAKWWLLGLIGALTIINLFLLRSICSNTWLNGVLGIPTDCRTANVDVSRNVNNPRLSLKGNELTIDGGNTIVLPSSDTILGPEGPKGSTGVAGAKGSTGATGATGAPAPPGGGTLDQAYNFGGPAAGRSINVLAANSPVQVNTTVPISGGPIDFNLGLTVTGDGGINNPVASGVGFAKLIGDFGAGTTDGSATIYSGNINSFASGAFGFNAFLDYPGSELYVNGLNNGFGGSFGQTVYGNFGVSISSGEATTTTGNGLGMNIGTGQGGSTSGNGGDLNFGTGNAPNDGNGGNVYMGTGYGKGINGTGGNINLYANGGDSNGGGMNFNTGNGSSNNGGNINFGAGSGANSGGNFFVNAGNSGNNQGGNVGLSAGGSTNSNGGDVNLSTGFSSAVNGGNFNFNAGGGSGNGGNVNANAGFATNGFGGYINLNAGGSANGQGGNLQFNGGSGALGGGSVNISGGNDTSGANNGGSFNLNSGTGLTGGDFNISAGNGNFSGLDNGGVLRLRAGDSNQFAGYISLNAGNSNIANGGGIYTSSGNGVTGGDINFSTGSSIGGSGGNGGNVNFSVGNGDGAGQGGYFTVNAGNNATGFAGGINMSAGSGGFGGGSFFAQAGGAFGGSNANGGTFTIRSGQGDGLGNGGDMNISAASGFSGGGINILAGSGDPAGNGGNVFIASGSSGAIAGILQIEGGTTAFGSGGSTYLRGGSSTGSGGAGGNITVSAGSSDPAAAVFGGNAIINGGSSLSGTAGDVSINGGLGLVNGNVTFSTAGIERGRFDNVGNFGIGTATPTTPLDVTNIGTDSVASFTGTSGTCTVRTDLGTLDCPSDRNLKTNILSIGNGLDAIMALQGVTYNWKANPDGVVVPGFIAQDVQKILPNLVTEHTDGTLSLSKDGILPYLVEAVKTQNGKLDEVNKQLVDQGLKLTNISDELKTLTDKVAQHDKLLKDQQDKIDALEAQNVKQADINAQLQKRLDALEAKP